MARLVRNLEQATADLGGRAHAHSSRVILELPDEVPWEAARERVSTVFGVANFSKSHAVAANLDTLKQELVQRLGDVGPGTFRVAARRSDKQFPRTSVEIEREVGGVLKAATGRTVDLDDPQLTVHLEVLRDRILYSFEKVAGPGGFPVGTAGKVMALLSGGIDSPVAAWRMMRRGCKVICVHFHAFPLLDRTTIDKAKDLARTLTRFQYSTRLLLVPFGSVQQTIVASCPAPLRVVLYRRFMVRIAERLSARHGAKALVTGESLGQVASQ
ncbi:MAG TPA: THUMP domain-containing protein, partial [Vicinamibacteria bacterium]|nr:THUMP domain-containing protein [Vicinamibacteria bacterium]